MTSPKRREKEVFGLLSGALGTDGSAVDPKAAWRKYIGLAGETDRYLRVLRVLLGSTVAPKFLPQFAALGTYIGQLAADRARAFVAPDLAAKYYHPMFDIDFEAVTPEDSAAFMAAFGAAKTCGIVTAILATCKTLTEQRGCLGDPQSLSDRFLRGGGLTFAPLAELPEFNLKEIYLADRVSADERRLLLGILHKLFAVGQSLYEAASAPEIDVGAFSSMVREAIQEIKKKIPRCEEAFTKLVESLDLLEGNFGSYYKHFVATNNPSIIMENFVLDVSQTGGSPVMAAQFKKIVDYYRRTQRSDDPKLRAIISMVDRNIQELAAANRRGGGGDEDLPDVGEDSPAGPAGPA